jgi:hypothetical protein
MRRIPRQRPVDRQADVVPLGRRDHAVGIPQGRSKRLLDENVRAMGGDFFHGGGMVGRCRT